MTKLSRCLLAGALILLPLSEAFAGSSTITTKDAAGATRTFFVTTDGGGNFYSAGVICDQSAAAACASVGTAGSPSTNALTVQAVTLGHGTAANAMRVELPTDGTGLVSAAQSGTWNIGTVTAVTSVTNPITVSTHAVTVASGGVASGSYASGSIASGALASGSIAAGAQVDLLTMRQTVAAGAVAANSLLTGGQYNSTPITLTNTQGSALQLDANGYLKVNTAAGAAAGGTSSNFGSAFPGPGTAAGFSDGTNMVAAKVGAVANVAAATNMLNTLPSCNYNATPLTVTDTRYQSVQCDVNGFMKVNVTNANANGQAVMASSSPVVIASNQTANALWGHVATGAAPPTGSTYISANTSGATGGLVQGLIQCDNTAVYDASTNGSTELKALTSGRTIYVCGYSILSGGTVNVKLIYGTGTACATGSNNMTPAYQLTAQVGIVDGAVFSRGLKTASANALCINTSAGIAVQAIVYYAVI